MRLDHLLSRETAEVETRTPNLRSIGEPSESMIRETAPMLQPSIAASESEAGMGNGDRSGFVEESAGKKFTQKDARKCTTA